MIEKKNHHSHDIIETYMSKRNKTRLISQVEQIERLLKDLKLELTALDGNQAVFQTEKDRLQVGDGVTILNPRLGQPSRGTLVKVNTTTNRGTVLTRTQTGREVKIVRHTKNLVLSQE